MGYDRKKIKEDFIKDIEVLCGTHGVSGFENDIVELVKKSVDGYVDRIETDVFGNLIAFKKGNGKKKLMIMAHTDEIGLIIKRIDSKGFLWFEALGIAPQSLFGKHVVIKTSGGYVDGIVNHIKPGRPDRITDLPNIQDFFIEIGAKDKAEAIEMGVEVGNPVSIDYPVHFLGKNRVAGKALDNRAALFILIELLKLVKDKQDIPDIYAVFSSQEEVGGRGAKVAAHRIKPDVAIALDICLANDIPDVPDRKLITELDKGPVIKIMDKLSTGIFGIICTPKVVEDLKTAAKNAGLNYQLEVYSAGSTDAAAVQTEIGGIAAGAVCFPTRYVHSYEMASIDDIAQCVELLYKYAELV
jgi:endoglucanase